MPNSGILPGFDKDVRSYQRRAKPPTIMPEKIIVSPLWEDGIRYVIEDGSKIIQFYQEIFKDNSRKNVANSLENNYDVKYFADGRSDVLPGLIPSDSCAGMYGKTQQEVFAYHASYKTSDLLHKADDGKEEFIIVSLFPEIVLKN